MNTHYLIKLHYINCHIVSLATVVMTTLSTLLLILMIHQHPVVAYEDHHPNSHTLISNKLIQTVVTFLALSLSLLMSTTALCSGIVQSCEAVWHHWSKYTRREYQRHRYQRMSHNYHQTILEPCVLVCQLWYMSSLPLVYKSQDLLDVLCCWSQAIHQLEKD